MTYLDKALDLISSKVKILSFKITLRAISISLLN